MPWEQPGPVPSGHTVFVNTFTLRTTPEEFEETFVRTARFLESQPGFLDYTLVRHLEEPLRYVNIAWWADAGSFRDAVTQAAFQPHAEALRAISTSESDLYTARRSASEVGK